MACRIVLCDDQQAFRTVLSLALDLEEGLDVVGEAADGIGVVEVVATLEPDVLLLDVAMPNRDGIEALPEIKSVSPQTAVVMLTAFGSERIRQRALDAGAAAFVEKGVDIAALIATVREVCQAA